MIPRFQEESDSADLIKVWDYIYHKSFVLNFLVNIKIFKESFAYMQFLP